VDGGGPFFFIALAILVVIAGIVTVIVVIAFVVFVVFGAAGVLTLNGRAERKKRLASKADAEDEW
jgi:Flp pilus assembly protein TadB